MWNLKKKQINNIKQNETQREHTRGYQRGKGLKGR